MLEEYDERFEYAVHKLLEARASADWEGFVHTALTMWESMPFAFGFFAEVPDDLKYDFALRAYQNHGDSVPAVRKAVRTLKRYGEPNLPEQFTDVDYIQVFRAGEEPINLAKYRLSWTTNKDVALFFLNGYRGGLHANYLYRAKIRPSDVIAYTNDMQENEIIQYRKVYDIEDITQGNKKGLPTYHSNKHHH